MSALYALKKIWKPIFFICGFYAFIQFTSFDIFQKPTTIVDQKPLPVKNETFVAEFLDAKFDFQYLITPKNCSSAELNVIVLSTLQKSEIREAIRNTWGNLEKNKINPNFTTISFLFSISKNENYDDWKKIVEEAEKYDDLIVTNLPDAYDLLAVKIYSLLIYSNKLCSNAKFVLKLDDDVVVNLPSVLEKLQDNNLSSENSLSGFVWENAVPKREKTNKWYMPRSFWPANFYPDYIDGPIYLIGKNVIGNMINEAKNYNMWKLEDVFWTGVIAEKLKIRRIRWNKFLYRYPEHLMRSDCPREDYVMGCHHFKSVQEISDGYKKLIESCK